MFSRRKMKGRRVDRGIVVEHGLWVVVNSSVCQARWDLLCVPILDDAASADGGTY